MLIALTKYETELSNYIHRAILLGPCHEVHEDGAELDLSDEAIDMTGYQYIRDMGVYAVAGPTWEDDLQTICDNVS